MSSGNLTTRQRLQLRTGLRHARDVRLYRRTLALLGYDRGKPVSAVADLLGVSRQSVYNWIARIRERGSVAELSDAPRSGRPACADEAFEVLLSRPCKIHFSRSSPYGLARIRFFERTGAVDQISQTPSPNKSVMPR